MNRTKIDSLETRRFLRVTPIPLGTIPDGVAGIAVYARGDVLGITITKQFRVD